MKKVITLLLALVSFSVFAAATSPTPAPATATSSAAVPGTLNSAVPNGRYTPSGVQVFATLSPTAEAQAPAPQAPTYQENAKRAADGRVFAEKLVAVAFPLRMNATVDIRTVREERPYVCRVSTLTLAREYQGLSIEQACYGAVFELQRSIEKLKSPMLNRSGLHLSTQ